MESVQTITASVGVPQTVIARPAPAPVVQAVPTELSPAQSVTAASNAESANNNAQSNPGEYQNTIRIDPATRELVARIVDLGNFPLSMTPAQFGKLVAEEIEKWRRVIRMARIKPE